MGAMEISEGGLCSAIDIFLRIGCHDDENNSKINMVNIYFIMMLIM